MQLRVILYQYRRIKQIMKTMYLKMVSQYENLINILLISSRKKEQEVYQLFEGFHVASAAWRLFISSLLFNFVTMVSYAYSSVLQVFNTRKKSDAYCGQSWRDDIDDG